jgi:hypothetical protein
MNLIVLIGSGAVCKMTVGQELMKITDYGRLREKIKISAMEV